MQEVGVVFIILIALFVVAFSLRRQRKRAAAIDLEDTSWLRREPPVEDIATRHAVVKDFHVAGSEARVTFDVPLPDEEDPVLNDLLVDEAVEVVREKRHTLPIGGVTEIVVLAGRDAERVVGRTQLPSPGELPPPIQTDMLNLTHIARDPFASQFEVDHSAHYETKVEVPGDDLGPIIHELKIPLGLERGLRTRGVDPATATGPDIVVALLEMFGYEVTDQSDGETCLAIKDKVKTFIRTEPHLPGSYPEVDEQLVRKFLAEFGTSGAARGMFITDKYGPFLIHDIEVSEHRVRFVTRDRMQRFIDSMAFG